jgi:hypothetical protein
MPVSAPAITANPASVTVIVGQTAMFSVIAASNATLEYQWQKNGVIIVGATSASYVTPPTHTSDDGSIFSVSVSNSAGSLLSSPAMLTVLPGAPLLAADVTNLNFGGVAVGANSSAVVNLTNNGTAPVTITSASITAPGFSVSSSLAGSVVAPGQTLPLGVVITPTSATPFSGIIIIASNATNSPISIPVSGTGVVAAAHSVSLSWAPSTSSNIAGYLILRGDQSGGPYTQLTPNPIAATEYTDSTVHAGQTYFYVVVAVDSTGQASAPSNEASVTVPSP